MILSIFNKPNPLGLGNEQLDRPAFDSTLHLVGRSSSKNAQLTITLYIQFEQVPGTTAKDADGNSFQLRPWKPGEWPHFQLEACDLATKVWNDGKLCLVTPPNYKELDWPPSPQKATHRPNVNCRLMCFPAITPSTAHCKARVVCLKDASKPFRSHMKLWGNLDTDPTLSVPWQDLNELIPHFTVPHEVGHFLGLHHVAEAAVARCASGKCTESNAAYGDSAHLPIWMPRNVMGMGMIVHDVNAGPWIKAMVKHTQSKTKISDWKAYGIEMTPKKI